MFTRFDFPPLNLFLLATLLLLPLPSSQAQNISINGSFTLTASENSSAWRSPNGDFAFGFQQLQSNPNLFVLSIWFDKIPDKTIVWYETTSYPVPRASTLQLDARGGLLLRDPQGSPLYTTSSVTGNLAGLVSQAFMQDNGNFVLTATDSSNVLWESFRHPVDTILPSQTIEIGETLFSRKTPTDLAQGRFCARMNGSGNFIFSFKTQPSGDAFDALYYSSPTSNENNASDSGSRVRFNETTAAVFVETGDGRVLTHLSNASSVQNASAQNYYYRASLDSDGVFTMYYHPKTGGNRRWSGGEQGRPSDANDICMITATRGSGACGYNSMCTVGDGRPVCECPPGFSPTDPNDTRSGCKSDYSQSCIIGGEEECSLIEIPDANWPMYDYEMIAGATKQECRDACLRDYQCGAAVLGQTGCWKKSMPIANGRNDPRTNTVFKRGKILNQTLINHPPQKPYKGEENNSNVLIVVGSVILGISVLANLFLAIAALFFLRNRMKLPVHNRSNLRCFTYKELLRATNGFREELGRGGFGTVYKGTVMVISDHDDSRTAAEVAVKELERAARDTDDKEFTTEVNVIGQIHHRNVVRLLGFCNEGPNRLLVYEHMARGNLATFLFDKNKNNSRPSWRQRTEIAVGIARGLAYLHEECSTQIIHCDIKPHNILLDECCTPRISDFGLAKLLMLDQSKTLTNIRGTKGYVSPEWFKNTNITAKVDVYSFGVVLLEIVACRKNVESGCDEKPVLSEWAWQCYVEGKVEALVEGDEEALSEGGMVEVERLVKVGLWCVEEDPDLRPSMRRICEMLQGTVEVGLPPLESSFTCISTHL